MGGLFVKSLAVCLLQAKNTTLPGLQQSQEEWGSCMCVCRPIANSWRLEVWAKDRAALLGRDRWTNGPVV